MTDLRIEKLIVECDRHLKRINSAYLKMSIFMPLNASKYEQLSEGEIEHIDQFLFRFAKLQDAIGEKLFILILEFLKEEHTKAKPFIDILNWLEQLGILEDKNYNLTPLICVSQVIRRNAVLRNWLGRFCGLMRLAFCQ